MMMMMVLMLMRMLVLFRCLELVELLAMFAPGDVPDALPEIMPFVQVLDSRSTTS